MRSSDQAPSTHIDPVNLFKSSAHFLMNYSILFHVSKVGNLPIVDPLSSIIIISTEPHGHNRENQLLDRDKRKFNSFFEKN